MYCEWRAVLRIAKLRLWHADRVHCASPINGPSVQTYFPSKEEESLKRGLKRRRALRGITERFPICWGLRSRPQQFQSNPSINWTVTQHMEASFLRYVTFPAVGPHADAQFMQVVVESENTNHRPLVYLTLWYIWRSPPSENLQGEPFAFDHASPEGQMLFSQPATDLPPPPPGIGCRGYRPPTPVSSTQSPNRFFFSLIIARINFSLIIAKIAKS